METKMVKIGPEKARALLASVHPHQRSVSVRLVEQYASDMVTGRWLATGATIVLGPTGLLLDGRHRLMAIVKSGVVLPFLVVTAESDDVAKGIDIGRARSVRDILSFEGHRVDASVIGAIVMEHSRWSAHAICSTSKAHRAALVSSTPTDVIELLTRWRRSTIRGTAPVMSVAVATYRAWPHQTIAFFEGLLRNTGTYLGRQMRLMQLFSTHISQTSLRGGTSGHVASYEMAYRTAQTWRRIVVDKLDSDRLLPFRDEGDVASLLTRAPEQWDPTMDWMLSHS